jgi:hypothetical protein
MRKAHTEEMEARRQALANELAVQRIEQVQRVLEATIELREIADGFGEHHIRTLSAAGKLSATLAGSRALQGPAFDDLTKLAHDVELRTVPAIQIVGLANGGILQIRELLETDLSLRLVDIAAHA